jgi:hypothetical protein
MLDFIDPIIALLTIGFGLFGFVSPRYTAGVLDMQPTGTTMGLSEIRASAGGLFVAVGAVCLLTGAPWAYFMLGVAYAGASTGRAISMVVDKPPQPKALTWFAFEAIPAAWLIWTNWPA